MRKNEGEMLRKLQKQGSSSSASEARTSERSGVNDVILLMSRDRCVPVIRGLVALMLSMDVTCNVDFFVVVSKVCSSFSRRRV